MPRLYEARKASGSGFTVSASRNRMRAKSIAPTSGKVP
jgi:hypothetical protein